MTKEIYIGVIGESWKQNYTHKTSFTNIKYEIRKIAIFTFRDQQKLPNKRSELKSKLRREKNFN